MPFDASVTRAPVEKFTDYFLLALCDLQLVTGTAILVAGFGQLSTISFYHRAIVTNLSNLILGSLWASRASGYRTVEIDRASIWEKARDRFRHLCILVSLLLLATFTAIQIRSEEQDWYPFESGKCYRSHDYSSPASQWLWVAGISSYAMTISLHSIILFHPRGETLWKDFTHIIPNELRKWAGQCFVQADKVPPCFYACQRSGLSKMEYALAIVGLVIQCSKLIFLTLFLGLAWGILQFWAIRSAGRGFQAVEVIFYAGFVLWNTFDVIDMKLSNSSLLTGSEQSWGFGQVLPLYMLLMLGFNVFDVIEKSWNKASKSAK